MKKIVGTLIFISALASNQTKAQTTQQTANEIDLICRIKITISGASNRGEIYVTVIQIKLNPPQVIFGNHPPVKAVITEKEIIWGGGRINRMTGLFSDAGSSGPCEKAPTQRVF